MVLEFTGELYFWKGPAPWHFVTVPDQDSAHLYAASPAVTYGWGMIPVQAHLGNTQWATSLWPKEGRYLVPVKAWVRRAENVDIGDMVTVRLTLDV